MAEGRQPRKLIILKEASRLFKEKGYMASTLRELAKRSGVQGGSIYHHFSSKQEILYQIMDYTMSTLIEKLEEKISGFDSPIDKLKHAVSFHIEYHVTERAETFVTDTEIRSLENGNLDKIIKKRALYEKIFRDILESGNSEGTMNISDTKIAAMAILQMCTGVSYWYRKDNKMKIEDITAQYLNFILSGVAGEIKMEGVKR